MDDAEGTTAAEVRAIRKALGMTLAGFGAEMGVTMRAVQHWEAGKHRPPKSAMMVMRRLRDERSKG